MGDEIKSDGGDLYVRVLYVVLTRIANCTYASVGAITIPTWSETCMVKQVVVWIWSLFVVVIGSVERSQINLRVLRTP